MQTYNFIAKTKSINLYTWVEVVILASIYTKKKGNYEQPLLNRGKEIQNDQ